MASDESSRESGKALTEPVDREIITIDDENGNDLQYLTGVKTFDTIQPNGTDHEKSPSCHVKKEVEEPFDDDTSRSDSMDKDVVTIHSDCEGDMEKLSGNAILISKANPDDEKKTQVKPPDEEDDDEPVIIKCSSGKDEVEDEEGGDDCLTLNSLSDADSEDDKWGVINLDDEDKVEDDAEIEKRLLERDPSQKLICYRCPNTKVGTFKDVKEYMFHTKRHKLANHFGCPTCRRPFTEITHCISHEIRVHNTEINHYNEDPVVKFAKEYVVEKASRNPETARPARPAIMDVIDLEDEDSSQENEENDSTDEESSSSENQDELVYETDCEDVRFYEDRVICSNSLMRYMGPEVNNPVEAYEIQLNHAGTKYWRSNWIAEVALQKHRLNVRLGRDIDRLGRFAKKKKKPNSFLTAKRKAVSEDFSSSSSSESDDSKDEDYIPPSSKKFKRASPVRTQPSVSPEPVLPKKQVQVRTMRIFPIQQARTCQKCGYKWTTQVDLMNHRNQMHPNTDLLDLMTVTVTKEISNSSESSSESDIEYGSGMDSSDEELFYPVQTAPKPKDARIVVHDQDSQSDLPNSNSDQSSKEGFLNALGLKSRIQLNDEDLLQKFKIPECHLRLERLDQQEIMKYVLLPDKRSK